MGAGTLIVATMAFLPELGVGGPLPRAAAASDPIMVIAGDISCSPNDPDFSGSDASVCQEHATANLAESIAPEYVMPGGDTQYTNDEPETEGEQPPMSDFTGGFDATWGQLVSSDPNLVHMWPTPGDHEYGDGNESDRGTSLSNASNYFTNFGPSGLNVLPAGVTAPSNDFYANTISVDGETWNIISLDSECAALPATVGGSPSGGVSGCAAGSPEETFLNNDLATHQGDCTLIHWHEPEWSEGDNGTDDTDYQAFWNDAYQYHVTMIVNGHDHDYERWKPLNTSGNPDPNGVNEIIAGTGGDSHSTKLFSSSSVVTDDFSDFGVLELTLHAGSASFAFKATNGSTPDSGTIYCTPTVSGVSAPGGSPGGGSTVTVTGTNFVGTPTVHFGSNLATNVNVTSPTTLTAKVPSGAVGTVDVTVANPPPTDVGGSGPTSPSSAADHYTYSNAPVVTSVGPATGPSGGGTSVTVGGSNMSGATAVDFGSTPGTNVVVNGGGTSLTVTSPAHPGGPVDVTVVGPGGTSTTSAADQFTYESAGYWLVASDGGIFAYNAPFYGSTGAVRLNQPIVGMAKDPITGGYWLVASDGGIFAYNAPFYGSTGAVHLNKPIVGMAADPQTGGYWLVASDGGIFAYDAPFYGSTGAVHLNKPIVGMAYDPKTGGYWLVASDGGIFAYHAPFQGSTGGVALNKPIVGMAVDPATGGYWLVASDGGIFAYNAPFYGSTGAVHLNKPIVGMAVDSSTDGYWLVASDGGIFSYNAPFEGSTGAVRLNKPVVGMAPD